MLLPIQLNYRLKNLILIACLLVMTVVSKAQSTLSLTECYTLARSNYPLIRQQQLIRQSSAYTIDNLMKGIWPQVNINAQATYQSEVTSIAVNIPGLHFDAPSKDQYKAYADIAQPITELFTIRDQRLVIAKNSELQEQSTEVELYKLKDRINQLYFGILLIDEQLRLNKLMGDDLESGKKRVEAAIANGIDYKSSLDKLKAELLRNDQRAIEWHAQRKGFTDMLSFFLNKIIDEKTVLEIPVAMLPDETIKRPELLFFENKTASIDLQRKLIRDKNIPHVSLFLQAGAGKPSPLNMISNSMKPYYLGGIRASWSLSNWYTKQKEKSLLHVDQQNNELQKDLFLFNLQLGIRQQKQEIDKLNQLLATDDEMVQLRHAVKNTSSVQLENGVITTSDYIREVNAEDQARQGKLLHQVQLLIAQYNLQNSFGN